MNSHIPFNSCQSWGSPTCGCGNYGCTTCNNSNDPLVDKLIGNAYHVVRTVYLNLGNLKLVYDFLNQYGMVLGLQSEDELKALTTKATYARVYGFDNTNQRMVTDYLYVADDRTGIIPNDPDATGSWVEVANSVTDGPGKDTSISPYIIYTYNKGSAIGGESTIPVPVGTIGVPIIVVNGSTKVNDYGFSYDATTLTVTLDQALNIGDEVHLFLTGTPAVPDNPNISDWVQINWLYSGGYAVGGEQVIEIPYTFQSVPAIYKNGERYYHGLAAKSYSVDAPNQRILLTEPLATNDRVIITIGGESETLIMSDRTLQEVARSTNVRDGEVILSTNTTQYLNGKKVLYDVVAQKAYGIPYLPNNSYINNVSDGKLTYSPGNVVVNLLELPEILNVRALWKHNLEENGLKLVDGSFQEGAVLATATDVIWDSSKGTCYAWAGSLPKTVAKDSTPDSTGGISSTAWVPVKSSDNSTVTTVSGVSSGNYKVNSVLLLADRAYARFLVVAGGTANGMDILDAGDGKTATLLIDSSTTIKSIGAKQDNLSTDETSYVQRWIQIFDGVIQFGNCTVGNLDFKGKFARQIKLTGDVKSALLTSAVWWDLASTDKPCESVEIDLSGYSVNCDFQNQTIRTKWIMTDYNNRMVVHDGKVNNMYDRGIGGGLSTYKLLDVYNMDFIEGSLHNGSIDPALAESCHFIGVFPGERTRIRFCNFKQLTDPVGTQNRNPGGVFLSGGNPAKEIEVSDCNFDNLGNLIGGNLVSPLDVYSHARSVTYLRNRFTRSRYVAFRSTNAERTVIENNEVLQNVPIAYDGGAAYNDAACLSVGLVPRGYALNAVDNYVYSIRNNVFKVTAEAGNCRAITAASDSTENVVHMISLENNTYSGVDTNTFPAVLLDKVLNFEIKDSSIKGFGQGYRIQRTDGAGTLMAAKGHSGKSTGTISTKSFACDTGIYCRLECTNLALNVEFCDLFKTNTPFTVRGIAAFRSISNLLSSTSSGDSQNNGAYWHINNVSPFASDPTGYTTNTYYRLVNNMGRPDKLSA